MLLKMKMPQNLAVVQIPPLVSRCFKYISSRRLAGACQHNLHVAKRPQYQAQKTRAVFTSLLFVVSHPFPCSILLSKVFFLQENSRLTIVELEFDNVKLFVKSGRVLPLKC